MVFSSIVFLIYFLPVFIIVYSLVPRQYKNAVILLGSILFYSWGAPKFIFVILGTTFLDFYLVRWMDKMEKRFNRRLILYLSISMNLGLLFYFKYTGFFIENVNAVLSTLFHVKEIGFTKLILPLGISFYTFETITYVVDVYRKENKPLENVWDYQLYILLFPKLIAGPIVKYHDIVDQLRDRSANDTIDDKLTGFYRFIIGLSKKVLIANQIGHQADVILTSDFHTLNSGTAWIGILAYTFQIYFDFSGYSDMAIGLGRMMGFKFNENFDNPYISQSITEYWRRWHISLTTWFRDYVFYPLSISLNKNKGSGAIKLYINLFIVFLLSGLWHGASWNYVFWGAWHGTFLIIERSFLMRAFSSAGKLFRTLFTFFIVVIGFVFFRIEKLPEAFAFIRRLFAFDFTNASIQPDKEFYIFFYIAIFFSFFVYFKKAQQIQDAVFAFNTSISSNFVRTVLSALLLILSVSFITASGFNPFIYFRF